MIKAIIFDCYGVLMTVDYVQQFMHEFLATTKEREQLETLHKEVDLGLISRDKFIDEIAKLANIDSEDVRKNFANAGQVNLPLLKYIETELKSKYKIGVLSNVSSAGIARNFTSEQMALFDSVTMSAEVGMAKPDPKIFELACQRLGVKPEQTVMIDDLEPNCLGAGKAGLKAILYKDNYDLQTHLDKILSK